MSTLPGDTIAAVSTPPGPGGVALVRLSGPRAVEIADAVFRGARPLAEAPTHTVHHGRVFDADGAEADEVLTTVLLGPSSYTTEDMIEFGCHGGTMASRRVLEACLGAGARLARAGEFTERAFLGGRIDLVQAEAVADVIAAETREGLDVALGQLEGGLSGRLAELRQSLIDYRAEVEALIDFTDQDIEPATTDAIAALGERAAAVARELLATADYGVAVREGVSVAIVGKPNVGKSTIMNALLGRERAIVTDEPGTTRDAIEETTSVGGVPVRLIDTAGWRDTESVAETEGVKRAKAAARGADIRLFVLDSLAGVTDEDEEIAEELAGDADTTITVLNKCDASEVEEPPREAELDVRDVDVDEPIRVTEVEVVDDIPLEVRCRSLLDNPNVRIVFGNLIPTESVEQLREKMGAIIVGPGEERQDEPVASNEAVVSNVRHVDALKRVGESVARSLEQLRGGESPDIVAQEVAEATDALGEITGETAPEDVLRRVFERFCVGK